MTQQLKQDMFAVGHDEPNERRPVIQALRGESEDQCGYFISEKEMEKADWKNLSDPIAGLKFITYNYNSGGKESGLLFRVPRMLVVQKTDLFFFHRDKSAKEKRLVVASISDENRKECSVAKRYSVLLLDSNNDPLHGLPLDYLAKGANQASFEMGWRNLVGQITKLHAAANGIPVRTKTATFASLCVYQFAVLRESAGTKQKSIACKAGAFVEPNQKNWESFFLGRDPDVAAKIIEILDPARPRTRPQPEVF